jgi:hypothetical protein
MMTLAHAIWQNWIGTLVMTRILGGGHHSITANADRQARGGFEAMSEVELSGPDCRLNCRNVRPVFQL